VLGLQQNGGSITASTLSACWPIFRHGVTHHLLAVSEGGTTVWI